MPYSNLVYHMGKLLIIQRSGITEKPLKESMFRRPSKRSDIQDRFEELEAGDREYCSKAIEIRR